MPKSYYLANAVVNAALRNTPFTLPATVYVAVYTVAPTPSGGGTEVGIGGYGRQTAVFSAPVNGSTSNTAEVLFPIASADWGTIVAFALFDASSGGNMLYFNNLSSSRDVLANDQLRFPAGQLVATEA